MAFKYLFFRALKSAGRPFPEPIRYRSAAWRNPS